MRERPTCSEATCTRQEELSLSKNSSFLLLKRSLGFNRSGKRSYTMRALSLKIARVLSAQSASVIPEKFFRTIANEVCIAVISEVKPCWRPFSTL